MEAQIVSAYQVQTQMTGKPEALQLRRANGKEVSRVKWANCSLMDFRLDVKAISDINFTCPHHYCEGSFTWNAFQWAEMQPFCPASPSPHFQPTCTFLVRAQKYGECLCQALLDTRTDSPISATVLPCKSWKRPCCPLCCFSSGNLRQRKAKQFTHKCSSRKHRDKPNQASWLYHLFVCCTLFLIYIVLCNHYNYSAHCTCLGKGRISDDVSACRCCSLILCVIHRERIKGGINFSTLTTSLPSLYCPVIPSVWSIVPWALYINVVSSVSSHTS